MRHLLLYYSKMIKACCCAVLILCCATGLKAQQVTVEATIDSLQLLIGEQAKIKLQVSMDANQKLRLPLLRDTLVRGVEILEARHAAAERQQALAGVTGIYSDFF